MNRDMLLDLFDAVDDRFVMEAAESRRGMPKQVPKRRVLLIAAAIAAAVLLVGCAATTVYLWLNELPTDPGYYREYNEETKTWDRFEKPDPEKVIFTGALNSAIVLAFEEWYDFVENHEPDDPLYKGDYRHPNVPDNLESPYQCLTPAMMEKLYEIMDKYHLKPTVGTVYADSYQKDIALELLGIPFLTRPDSGITVNTFGSYLDAPYNFKFEYFVTMDDGRSFMIAETYRHKEYMPRYARWHLQLDQYEQWQYTNTEGVQLLMALDPGISGLIVAEQEDGFITMTISDTERYQNRKLLDKEDLELFADSLNFSFTPKAVDPETAQPILDEAEQAYEFSIGLKFHSFEDGLKRGYGGRRSQEYEWEYAWFDLQEDGVPELFIGLGGKFETFLLQNEEGIVEMKTYRPTYFCKDGVALGEHRTAYYTIYDFYQTGDNYDTSYRIKYLIHKDGKWYEDFFLPIEEMPADQPTITQEQAQAYFDKYPVIELKLDWKPLQEFPLSDGTTFGQWQACQ